MPYKTLAFKDFDLTFSQRGYNDVVPGYYIRDVNYWWLEPSFLARLPTVTLRSVKEFLLEHNEKVTAILPHAGAQAKLWLEKWEEKLNDPAVLMQEALQPYGAVSESTSSTFSLFNVQPEVVRPKIIWDGRRESNRTTPVSHFYWSPAGNGGRDYDRDGVREWNYKPSYKFFSEKKEKSKLFFGLELEVNTLIPWSELRKVMTEVAPKQEEFLYAMSDSSISGDMTYCYEIVSHPMTPRRMRKEYRVFFSKLQNLVEAQGKKLEDVFDFTTRSTGIHIHASRSGFSSRYHQRRFHTVWNTDVPSVSKTINKLARRTLQGHRYASPDPDFAGRRIGYCLGTKMLKTSDRYHSCIETPQTYEVRVFTGTPEIKNILHSVDSVEAMWYYTRDMPLSAFKFGFEKDFTQWLHKQPKQRFRTLKETLACA